MYVKEKSIMLPASASAEPSNLARLCFNNQVYMCVVHKGEIIVICVSTPAPESLRVKPRLGPRDFIATQAKWVCVHARWVLAVVGSSGALLYDWDGSVLLRAVQLEDDPLLAGTTVTARGIGALTQQGIICFGTSRGEVISIAASEEVDLSTASTHRHKLHCDPVVALDASDNDVLVSADQVGHVMINNWNGKEFTKMATLPSYGTAATCLALWQDLLLVGYLTGHLRIFSISMASLQTEVCGHARAVSAVDITHAGLAISAGEDSFVRGWQLWTDTEAKVEHKFSQSEPHLRLCGISFRNPEGRGYIATAYDLPEMIAYTS